MAKKDNNTSTFSDDALDNILKEIKKTYGDGAVMMLGESPVANIEVIPSGSLALDLALGVGGYPKGRIVEIFGPESSGKTTLATHAVAQAQQMGLRAAYIDAEHAFDKEYAECLGVDCDHLLFAQPDCGEDALEIAEKLISSGKIGICVIDSVAALTPKAEIEGELGQAQMGLQARLMSKALRKMTSTIAKSNCLCIFINQIREKIGVMFGNPETTTGGNALKFYATQRLEVRKVTTNKDGDEAISNLVRVKVIKNKVAPPFRKAEFEIEFGKGINRLTEVANMAIDMDIIQKSGSWFSYDGGKVCQGRANLITLLEDNQEFYDEIEEKVINKLNNKESGVLDFDDVIDEINNKNSTCSIESK